MRPSRPGSGVSRSTTTTSISRPPAPVTMTVTATSTKKPAGPTPRPTNVVSKIRMQNLNPAFRKVADSNKENGSEAVDMSEKSLSVLLRRARQDGKLDLTGKGLSEVPQCVWDINMPKKEEHIKGFSLDRVEEPENWWEFEPLSKLFLSSNALTTLQSDVKNLSALTVLDLHDNKLVSLPNEMEQLKNLTKLFLNSNSFEEVPSCIYRLKNLTFLSLKDNQLKTISQDLGDLCELQQLELSNNCLSQLPQNIGFLSEVTKLDVSNNKLKDLPFELGSLNKLSFFDASHNLITNIGETFKNSQRLERFYLHHNRLVQLPTFGDCPNLKELLLCVNRITEITDDLLNVASLVQIDLSDNKIEVIPDNIVNLRSLERLDLSNNSLISLPPVMGTMTHLVTLKVEGNGMKTIRRDILQRSTKEVLQFLKSRIEEADLKLLQEKGCITPMKSTLPENSNVPSKFVMKNSKALDLSNQGLDQIPDEVITNAVDALVERIDFSKNSLTEFPKNCDQLLPILYEININFNRLTIIPSGLSIATKLTTLHLANNLLTDIPEEISTIPYLREICISCNKFTRIPPTIYKCVKLEILIASNNLISAIDVDDLSSLTFLTVLDLRNNNIQVIPPKLGNMLQIKNLQLEGNGFRVPRPQILEKGTPAVMAWLRDRIPT